MRRKKEPVQVAVIGECMIELAQRDRGGLALGCAGDTYNTAVYLRRLLSGNRASVRYVTALGTDALSENMLAQWRAEGLDTGFVRRDPGRLPGLYYITTDDRGERAFWYWRGQSAARRLLAGAKYERIGACLAAADLVFFSGITLAILTPRDRTRLFTLLRRARRGGARVAFDSNYRRRLWRSRSAAAAAFDRAYALTDIALVSFDNEHDVFGDESPYATTGRLADHGVAEIVTKDGPRPALARSGTDHWISAADRPARVVDTTAAGDAFNAGYLAARLIGRPIPTALRAAHALATRVIAHRGAILPAAATPSLPVLLKR